MTAILRSTLPMPARRPLRGWFCHPTRTRWLVSPRCRLRLPHAVGDADATHQKSTDEGAERPVVPPPAVEAQPEAREWAPIEVPRSDRDARHGCERLDMRDPRPPRCSPLVDDPTFSVSCTAPRGVIGRARRVT